MNRPHSISFAEALQFWLKLGFISFGGPAGQIAIMHRELVERRRWISEKRFMHALNYCMILPGPEAQQLATYIGWLMHGTWGGIVAGALFVLPSLIILIALSWAYVTFGTYPLVAGLLTGIKPAVTAIILFAAWRIGRRALKNSTLKLIAAAAFAAIFVLNVPFPAIVLGAAVLGAMGASWMPKQFSGGGHAPEEVQDTEAVIDDHTPSPAHAVFKWTHFTACLLTGAGMWLAAMLALASRHGADGTLVDMGWFFTKAALLTFGGAYAVLPYVYQGAVEGFGWLTPQQMIDGLALGETTPGPLIMVVAFVGYVGGSTKAVLGPEALFLGGVLAACVVTYFTFLPSFLFILLGGPLVESTHGQLRFTAPLTAITAAVVGVIVNLGLFFAWKVWWPQATASAPFSGGFEWFSMLLTILAAAALLGNRAGIIPVILVCGAAGIARTMLGF